MSRANVLMLIAVALGGCASSYQVVQFPQREADLYPLSQTRDGISIAIDEITDPARTERYFGANLLRVGVLPLAIVASNNGAHRVDIRPADVLLHRGTQIIDPLPIETVVAMAKNQHGFLRSRTRKEVERYFDDLAFKQMVLSPGETYQGIMFFPIPREERSSDSSFTMLALFPQGRFQILVGSRDLDTRNRMHFGPFSLTTPRQHSD